nr:hypothetical protein [Tanacetum cinerariifolium]
VLETQNQVFHKLENANVELEFQVFNYAKENARLKATYKNLFDSIYVTRAQTKTKIASLQNELQCNIYKNAKLRTQLFKKVSDEKENTQDTSKNTKFAKQPIAEILPKIGETNALSKPVTSNSVSIPQVSKGMNNAKVIAPGMFKISPDKISREAKKVPNTNDRVPSTSKSSRSMSKDVKVEEHHRNLLLSKKNKHMSSACNSSKIDSQDVKSKVVSAKCKKCLNFVNHDVCLNNCMNGKKSRGKLVAPSGDNACTSNTIEPKIKRFPNSTSLLGRLSRFVCGAFHAHDRKSKASHQFRLEVYGNCPLRE